MASQLLHSGILAAVIGLFAGGLFAQAPAPAEARCGLGGIVPGSAWPGSADPAAYVPGTPRLYKPLVGATSQKYKASTAGYDQFVVSLGGKVVAVIREYDGGQEGKVMDALKARYGDPANPGIETGKMGLVTGKVQSRTIWLDPACGTRIEFVRQDSGMFKGSFAKSTRIAVIVTLAEKKNPGDSPNPLE